MTATEDWFIPNRCTAATSSRCHLVQKVKVVKTEPPPMNSTEQIESPKVEGDREGRGDAASSEPRKQTQVHQTNTD